MIQGLHTKSVIIMCMAPDDGDFCGLITGSSAFQFPRTNLLQVGVHSFPDSQLALRLRFTRINI